MTAGAGKASGTVEDKLHGTMSALANDEWYRGHLILLRDSATAGKGKMILRWGEDSLQQLTAVSEHDIATQFADTVSMAFFIGWLAGGAVTTQMNFGMCAWRIYS